MGFGLPAAMGVAIGYRMTPCGYRRDGGQRMNIQELATIREFGLDIKVAVLNNGYLGMVRRGSSSTTAAIRDAHLGPTTSSSPPPRARRTHVSEGDASRKR